MKSVNKVILLGTLGKDPELKYTPKGTAVAKFSLATNYKPKDGEEETEWHNLVCWQKLAEIAGEYLKKGQRVYVEGRLKTESWEKEGQKKYMTTVVVHDLVMLTGKNEGGSRGGGDEFDQRRSNVKTTGTSSNRVAAPAKDVNPFDDEAF